jgi:stalled ribosome rescue protein Dom34
MCSQRRAPARADQRVVHSAKAIASEIQSAFQEEAATQLDEVGGVGAILRYTT